jgi:hypothetical protein
MLLRQKAQVPKRKPRKLTKAELDAQAAFEAMQAKWDKVPKFAREVHIRTKREVDFPDLSTPVGRTNANHLPSVNPDESDSVGLTAKAQTKVYTGSKMKNVSQMHKSNAVPVFDDELTIQIARMRR